MVKKQKQIDLILCDENMQCENTETTQDKRQHILFQYTHGTTVTNLSIVHLFLKLLVQVTGMVSAKNAEQQVRFSPLAST